ncbi:3-dehydrosphinganine reductase [Conglomerata obtusa]
MVGIILFLLFICLVSYQFFLPKRSIDFSNKKALIIGGSSGLGLSLAKLLKKLNADVTIASRNVSSFQKMFNTYILDVTNLESFTKLESSYDYIFCCAGSAKAQYFSDLHPSDYRSQFELNYMGTINSLYHFYKHNKRPFSFIMISSTTAYFTFPGYSAYAPTKAALKSFFDSAFMEMKKSNINLYIYYVNSMETPGFENENATKPSFTKEIEGSAGMCPDFAARRLINGMAQNNVIVSDLLTNFFRVKSEACSLTDYLMVPFSFMIYPLIRLFVKIKFRKVNIDNI